MIACVWARRGRHTRLRADWSSDVCSSDLRGTPARDAAVIQTQIVLAVVGAAVMIVVGASLARAFGIVGVASLVRYRAKVSDPKDAAVMLSTLAAGLASGVGIYVVASIFTVFVLVMLWVLES